MGKKDFTNNPAYEMLKNSESENQTVEKAASTEKEKDGNFEPIKRETKSKKIQILIKPTLYDRLRAKAKDFDVSMNELINQILEKNV